MNILLTNDDGFKSKGIKILYKYLKKLTKNILIVAPDRERSAVSQSITLNSPIRMFKIKNNFYAIDGTPTDCVYLTILGATNFKPDIVISGINKGPNMGEDIVYSGTVAAAIEATFANLIAFSVSIDAVHTDKIYYETAAEFCCILLKKIIKFKLPKGVFLNVNVPNLPKSKIKGVKITKLGTRKYLDKLIKRTDPKGNPYFWLAGDEVLWSNKKNTDYYEVKNGFISVTPLHLDLTAYKIIPLIKKWNLKF
jgi:5'-nucleotidase